MTYAFQVHPMEFWVTQAVNQSQYSQGGLAGVSSMHPYLVCPILWIQARTEILLCYFNFLIICWNCPNIIPSGNRISWQPRFTTIWTPFCSPPLIVA